jgi:hypothetical protein
MGVESWKPEGEDWEADFLSAFFVQKMSRHLCFFKMNFYFYKFNKITNTTTD